MKRPESLLAASVFGLLCAVGTLIAVSMASCQTIANIADLGGDEPRNRTAPGGSGAGARTPPKKDAQTSAPVPAVRDVPRTVGEPDLRVRILTAVDTVRVEAGGGVRLASGDPRGLTADPVGGGGWATAPVVNLPVSVSLRSGVWTLSSSMGERSALAGAGGGGGGALLVAPAVEGQTLLVNGAPFPGVLRLSPRSDVRPGAFDVIEFVGLEEYLPGVVAKEMLAGWPAETYKAQAIAARSYAMHERERSIAAGQSFDLESSDRDQVYSGVTANRAAIAAVNATRGQALFDGDAVLRAYFSSTCGGRTASARDTWPTGPGFEYNLAGPIQARTRPHACQSSPLYRWKVERTRAELTARLRAFGERNGLMVRQIRDLRAIEPMTLNADGRPSRYKIIQTDGKWFQLSGEELRLACNTSVSGTSALPVPGGAPTGSEPAAAVPGSPVASASSRPARVGAAGGGGGGSAGGGSRPEFPDITRATRVNSSDLEFTFTPGSDKVVISGRGFGHGVGLCQYCAKGLAERGEDHRMMLMRFYPGAMLKQAY
jgi:stage II sporulation protein D